MATSVTELTEQRLLLLFFHCTSRLLPTDRGAGSEAALVIHSWGQQDSISGCGDAQWQTDFGDNNCDDNDDNTRHVNDSDGFR